MDIKYKKENKKSWKDKQKEEKKMDDIYAAAYGLQLYVCAGNSNRLSG